MSDSKQRTLVSVALSSDDVWHLALFLKRVSWDEIRGNAQDDAEADAIRTALQHAMAAFADAGIAPR